MDNKEFMNMIMNPVRQRIIQYLILHEKGTAKEIQEELNDVPTASLYRHIKILFEGGCLEVVAENKIRGTLEKTYGLVQQPVPANPSKEDMAAMFQLPLISLQRSFHAYFNQENIDPLKDMMSLSTCTLMLTDDEFTDLLGKLAEDMNEYVSKKAGPGRKPRRLTIISSPCEE